MGIALPAFKYLLEKIPALALGPSCVTLGKQSVLFTPSQALELAVEAGLYVRRGDTVILPPGHPYLATAAAAGEVVVGAPDYADSPQPGTITDVALFNLLGFTEVRSTDVSAYEGADLIFDLNDQDGAAKLGRKFHFVLDGGTMEHVFHVPNALKNIFDLLEVGGCVLHQSPVHNYVDHGFYQFSPTLLFDYYTANGFTVLDSTCLQHERLDVNAPYKYTPYRPGSLDRMAFGGFDSGMYDIFFLARKTSRSTWDAIPQQSRYSRYGRWESAR